MNKRIRELYDQCIVGRNNDAQWIFEGDLDPEKFAQLIVKECIEACSRANEIRHFVPPTQEQVVLSCMREIETTFRS